MSPITTHVLDTARGCPAAAIALEIEQRTESGWVSLSRGITDTNGRCSTLLAETFVLVSGVYRLTFETGAYFDALGVTGFYPSVSVVFEVRDPVAHYHVPLLVSPYGFSTYRGS